MAWVVLVLAGLFETAWAVGMKYSHGFTKLWPSLWTIATMLISVVLLAQALKSLPVGTAYAVWTGIGAVGAATLGIVLLKEPASLARVACILLIVVGIVGLRLTASR